MLSPLEKTCLRWLSEGRTRDEIALLEGRSVAQIELCIAAAITSLEAQTVDEAVNKAANLGL